MTKDEDAGKSATALNPAGIARRLGGKLVDKVDSPAMGQALLMERKHCPIMCRLLDEANNRIAELEAEKKALENNLLGWQEGCAQLDNKIDELQTDMVALQHDLAVADSQVCEKCNKEPRLPTCYICTQHGDIT